MAQPQLLHGQHGLGRLDPRLRGDGGGGELGNLLLAHGPGGLQAAGTLGIGLGFDGVGPGLGQCSAALGHLGPHAFGIEHGQHLAGLDGVAHSGPQLGQAQPVGLGRHTGFLPGGHAAVGGEGLAPGGTGGAGHGHRHSGFGFGGSCISRRIGGPARHGLPGQQQRHGQGHGRNPGQGQRAGRTWLVK